MKNNKSLVKKLGKEITMMYRFIYELIRGTYAFHRVQNCITIYGSARFSEDNKYYQMAQTLSQRLAQEGFAIMTGGGPGIMEAANRGAKQESNGLSVGCTIDLPFEEKPNEYLDKTVKLRYFFSRKLMLTKHSVGFVAMPGGFGTLDELFEIAVLVQTKRIKSFPIVLMGSEFWQPLLDYLENVFVAHKTINPTDISDIFFLTDSPEEAVNYIKDNVSHE